MDWIFDHLQIVILVLFALASLAKKVLESRAGTGEPPPVAEDYEEEDWHQPNPPQYQHLPSIPPPLPVVTIAEEEAAALLQRQEEIRERLRAAKAAKAARVKTPPAGRKAREARKPATAPVSSPFRSSLRGRGELRRAFVMKEILDPPVGLR